jgi:hypothetical protein
MIIARRCFVMTAIALLVAGSVRGMVARAQSPPAAAPPLEGPALLPEAPRANALDGGADGPLHEGFLEKPSRAPRVWVPKPPPAPIVEQRGSNRPSPDSEWVPGYWGWDPKRNDYVWMTGGWRVPQKGMIWIAGRWARDNRGWYRIPGFWRDYLAIPTAAAAADREAWRTSGPPTEHPDDTPGPAPSPDFFYVAGHYHPEGDRPVWTAGFYAHIQPGWDWIPARWVRLPDGWDFREGYWIRSTGLAAAGQRHVVARPTNNSTLPAAIVEPAVEPRFSSTAPETIRVPTAETAPNALPNPAQASIPGSVVAAPAPAGGSPYATRPYVVVDRRGRYRYGAPNRVTRPPGSDPYGPAGATGPAPAPRFFGRLLNRVLP